MPNKIYLNNQEVISLYLNGLSSVKIAKMFNCSKQTINKTLKENNIPIRNNSHCQPKYKIDENIFENIDTYEKAYWLGMLTGDGCVNIKNELSLSLQEKDKEHVFKFRDFLKSNHPISKNYNKNKKDGSHSISYVINISNKKIVNDLRRIGFTNKKTYHMDFPNINENLISNYMLGLVDSDGSFNIKKQSNSLSFNFVGPIEFVEKFQQILIEKCNVSKTKLGLSKTTDFIRLVYYGGYKNILKIVKFLYEKSTTYLSRKKNIAVNYLLTKYPDDKTLNDLSSS